MNAMHIQLLMITTAAFALSSCTTPSGGSGGGSGTGSGGGSGSPVSAADCNSDGEYSLPLNNPGAAFACMPSGQLLPTRGDYDGDDDQIVISNMRFPIKNPPAYANSQVYRYKPGYNPNWLDQTGAPLGPFDNNNSTPYGIEQCEHRNYSYPWQDTFCESRAWDNEFCDGGEGHQGIDIRGPVCDTDNVQNEVVAVSNGTIEAILPHYQTQFLSGSSYSFVRYFHMMSPEYTNADLSGGAINVSKGDRLGNIGITGKNGTLTTRHLHFEIHRNVYFDDGTSEIIPVSPYATLVDSYRELLDAQ